MLFRSVFAVLGDQDGRADIDHTFFALNVVNQNDVPEKRFELADTPFGEGLFLFGCGVICVF